MSEVAELVEKQNRILKRLEELKQSLLSMREEVKSCTAQKSSTKTKTLTKQVSFPSEVVINAHPAQIPYSILALKSLWKEFVNVEVSIFTHSSVNSSDISKASKEFSDKVTSSNSSQNLPTLKLIIIWKNVQVTELLVSSAKFVPIFGEINMIRFFNRVGPSDYEKENHFANQVDSVLDICHQLVSKPSKGDRQSFINSLGQILGKSSNFFNSKEVSAADVAVFSTLKNVCGNNVKELPANLSSWLQKLSKSLGC